MFPKHFPNFGEDTNVSMNLLQADNRLQWKILR
jgi:hypothetical protein